ncbi:MAG: winged helix DNA-binding domain-containing protein [Anaerolineales bacterium]
MEHKIRLSAYETRMLRLKSQRLLLESGSPAAVLNRVVGVQAQEMPAGELSIWARSSGLTADDVRQARLETRTVVWTWCMRGTLHLVRAADAPWLLPLLGPVFIQANQRRFRQLGWDDASAAAGLAWLQAALEESESGLVRSEIIRGLEQEGLPYEGQAPYHLIARAALEGLICAGPEQGGETAYVLFERWIGSLQPLPRQEAILRLARRYLAAFGPAGPQDLARWSGLRQSEANAAWESLADEIVAVDAAGVPGWLLKSSLPWLDEGLPQDPQVKLLPRFDTYLLGYRDRSLAVDTEFAREVNRGGGIIHAVLLVDGQVRGTWKLKRYSKYQKVLLAPFEPLPEGLLPAIRAEVEELGRFLGEALILDEEIIKNGGSSV